jgi:single-strand DNA-binding protein
MSASINVMHLMGRLGRDAEAKVLANGKIVINFSLATDEGYKDREGNWIDKAEWHECSYFTTEAGSNYLMPRLTKGSTTYVMGKKETRKYVDKNGVEKFAVSCVANDVKPCGAPAAQTDSGTYAATQSQSVPAPDFDAPF